MKILYLDESKPAQLYHRYSGEFDPQPCYIALGLREERLWADYNANVGGAVPMDAWHGFERRYSIPCLTATAANALLREIAPYAERVLAGYDSHWDGHRYVAVLDEEAHLAEEAIELLCEAAGADGEDEVREPWEAEDYFANDPLNWITAETSDEELLARTQQEENLAEQNGERVDGIFDYLVELRNAARAAAEEEEEKEE